MIITDLPYEELRYSLAMHQGITTSGRIKIADSFTEFTKIET